MSPNQSSISLSADTSPPATRTKQHSTSRMMKTTRRGRPFTKDTHDLFATLIVSLNLTTHRQYFKTYHNSFTTDEAAENLSALKFSQSNRVPDPNEPSRVVTTTTTTTFSMNREMAKGICQHFMDARLIENASDVSSTVFKEKGVYVLTPKGLHILERFITKNGVNGEHLLKVFSSQPICMKLLHLERRSHDDELLVNTPVLEVIFRRFVGRAPNLNHAPIGVREAERNFDLTLGVELQDVQEKVKGQGVKNFRLTFSAMTAIDWLCDFTTVCGKDEAAEIAAHFARLGFICLVMDKSKREQEAYDDRDVIIRVDDSHGGYTEGHFRCHLKVIYGITEKGRTVAKWENPFYGASSTNYSVDQRSSTSIEEIRTIDGSASPDSEAVSKINGQEIPPSPVPSAPQDNRLHRKVSRVERIRADPSSNGISAANSAQGLFDSSSYNSRDSNTNRLKNLLEEPALRSLFREFLRQNFCEENLSFWLDVQDFKRRFHTTSSAVAVRSPQPNSLPDPSRSGVGKKIGRVAGVLTHHAHKDRDEAAQHGFTAMEKHQQDLVSMAFVIYNAYLAPGSPCELNIEHQLRSELVAYMNRVLLDAKNDLPSPMTSSTQLTTPNAEISPGVNPTGLPADATIEEKKAAIISRRFKIPLHASQLQTMVRLYERIQDHIFRLMATDSVPRFIKDPRFLQLVKSVEEYTEAVEAGRIDAHEIGPAIGRDVFEAMDLRSHEMTAQSSLESASRQSAETSSSGARPTTSAVTSAQNSIASPKLEQAMAR